MNCGCARHCHQEFSHYTELSYLSSLDFKDVLSAENKARLDLKYSWYPRGVEYDIVSQQFGLMKLKNYRLSLNVI